MVLPVGPSKVGSFKTKNLSDPSTRKKIVVFDHENACASVEIRNKLDLNILLGICLDLSS